jgi:hypothetical protein
MMKEGLLFESIAKRDDDATLEVTAEGQVFVTTTEDLTELEPWDVRLAKSQCCCLNKWSLLNPDLLHDECHAMLPSVHTRIVRHVFLTNLLFIGVTLIVGLLVSYWINQWAVLVGLVTTASTLFAGFYITLVMRRSLVQYGWWEAGFLTMSVAAGFALGATAGLSSNVGPFEWCAALWAQTIMVLLYAQWSPRNMGNWFVLGALMVAATMCVWALGIVAAFESHDWLSSGVVLLLSVCTVFYQLGWIRNSVDASYSVSWRDLTVATMEFYGMPLVWIQRQATINQTNH